MTGVERFRIGYLVQEFAPETGAGPARVLETARQWKAEGAEVVVLTGMPNRPEGRIHAEYRRRVFLEEEREGHRVLRSWLYASPRRGFARTLVNNLTFMVSSSVHGTARLPKVDVLIASGPPFFVHVAGELMRRARRIPLVLEVRDLWPDYIEEMGVVRNRTALRALFGLERYLLRQAREVIVVTESFRKRVIEKGVPADRVHVIPNGVDTEFYYRDPEAPAPFDPMDRPGRFVVGYLGNFGAGQELRTVLEAAALLVDEPDIHFVLAGDGPERRRVVDRWRELGLSNVSIEGPLPKQQTRAFYNRCDVGLVPLAPLKIFQETIPSKIVEVMACEVPVLASLAGEGQRIVEASGGGVTAPPGDPVAMAEAIRKLRALGPQARAELGRAGRAYVREHFDRRRLATRYHEILRESIARR
jgi:colanic acid biosynthesis glycosyl transferase WcaI